jgi:hypothetical protein
MSGEEKRLRTEAAKHGESPGQRPVARPHQHRVATAARCRLARRGEPDGPVRDSWPLKTRAGIGTSSAMGGGLLYIESRFLST